MEIKEVSEIAKKKLGETLNKTPNAVVSISKKTDSWSAIIEVVEEEFLPGRDLRSMGDIIGVYEVSLSNNGEILGWTKKSSHKRGSS
jgi:hypothetical protein